MSKSDPNPKASVSLLDTPDAILKKFKSAVTDSEAIVRYADGKDGINNLMAIYSCCTGLDYEAIEREFDGKGYGDFQSKVAEAVIEERAPCRRTTRDSWPIRNISCRPQPPERRKPPALRTAH